MKWRERKIPWKRQLLYVILCCCLLKHLLPPPPPPLISLSFHYSTYFSSVFSISSHYSIYFSSIFSISFHYSTCVSSVSNSEKIWEIRKKGKLNSEMIWKIWKTIVKWYGKYGRKPSWEEYWAMFSSYQKQALTVMISPLCRNCHDITVVLLNVELNTINLTLYLQSHIPKYLSIYIFVRITDCIQFLLYGFKKRKINTIRYYI
jgi:hypothetical protein